MGHRTDTAGSHDQPDAFLKGQGRFGRVAGHQKVAKGFLVVPAATFVDQGLRQVRARQDAASVPQHAVFIQGGQAEFAEAVVDAPQDFKAPLCAALLQASQTGIQGNVLRVEEITQ